MSSNLYRRDFPLIAQGGDFIYFDNAATTQRPQAVLDAVDSFYRTANANPLRGLYRLSVAATDAYESARQTVAQFVGAKEAAEIVFTRNATESLNLLAYTFGLDNVHADDEIVVSVMEHHSNLLPWQMVSRKTGARLVFLEPDSEGEITRAEYEAKITRSTKILAVAHVSNVLGTTNPVAEMARYAHKVGNNGRGAIVVVDGAQSVPHIPVDVQALGTDFFAFSGHKLGAPMGIGVLYGRKALLENMSPFLSGGEMIEYVTRRNATYAEVPHKFEAGTVNANGAVGLAAAIGYLRQIGMDSIAAHETALTKLLFEGMSAVPHVRIIGSSDAARHSGIITFTLDGVHPHDIASILDSENIAIRAGHHCAQPLMEFLKVQSTARASLWLYNTEEEVQRFVDRLGRVREWMGYGA